MSALNLLVRFVAPAAFAVNVLVIGIATRDFPMIAIAVAAGLLVGHRWVRTLGHTTSTKIVPRAEEGVSKDEERREYEKVQATARRWAVIVLVIGWAIAYWEWPAGFTDLPLAAVKVGALLHAVASAVIALIALVFAVVLWI